MDEVWEGEVTQSWTEAQIQQAAQGLGASQDSAGQIAGWTDAGISTVFTLGANWWAGGTRAVGVSLPLGLSVTQSGDRLALQGAIAWAPAMVAIPVGLEQAAVLGSTRVLAMMMTGPPGGNQFLASAQGNPGAAKPSQQGPGTAIVPKFPVGLGGWGEARLAQVLGWLGFKPRNPFWTSLGRRYVDRLLNGIAHEAKAGLDVGLTSRIRMQVLKDAELITSNQIQGAVWHFFQGAKQELLDFLTLNDIKYVVH